MTLVSRKFLAASAAQLARLGALVEWAPPLEPPTSIAKIRLITEVLARLVAAVDDSGEPRADMLVRLQRGRQMPDKVADVCHDLRKLGKTATHEDCGSPAQALTSLKLAL